MNQSQNIKNAISEKDENKKSYPIKEFLLAKSWLVKFEKKEKAGKDLTKQEQSRQEKICELRDKTFNKIIGSIAYYYDIVIAGDYRFDGMPEIDRGIRGWIEYKIWKLLIEIGEPGKLRFQYDDDFWVEA